MKAISIKNRPTSRRLQGVDLGRVGDISRTVSTPFMLLRTGLVRRNVRRLREALPGVDIYYAVKANNHPAIITTLLDEGCCFDISSARELKTIIDLGGQADAAIHTNPIKSRPEFDAAVELGETTFVADNISELDKFARYDGRAGVMVRFKTHTGGAVVDLSYKFGAAPEDIPAMLDRIVELNLPFRGFCFHVGSQCTNAGKYVRAIRAARLMIDLARRRGLTTPILDIGGGFPIEYTRQIPAIEIIGAKIRRALTENIDPAVRVICEPGRFICGDAVILFSSVIGKSVREGVQWYYIDDGLYGSFSGRLFDHCVYQVLTRRNTRWEKSVLAGPTCDSFDVIYDECLMPPLDIGDVLMFPSMGAYCSVSATDFNGLGQTRVIPVDW